VSLSWGNNRKWVCHRLVQRQGRVVLCVVAESMRWTVLRGAPGRRG